MTDWDWEAYLFECDLWDALDECDYYDERYGLSMARLEDIAYYYDIDTGYLLKMWEGEC